MANTPNHYLFRVVSVLKSFSLDETELGPADLARKVKIPRSTAFRILSNLASHGFLDNNPKTGKYSIGPALYALGSLYLGTTNIVKASEPVIKVLNDLTAEAIQVGIYDKGNIVFIMREETQHAFRFSHHVGTVMPAYASAMGLAYLSTLSEEEIDNVYPDEQLKPIAKHTITSKTKLKQELNEIRKSGFSVSVEGSWDGAGGVGSVIRDYSGRAVAAMSIAFPIYKIDDSLMNRWSNILRMGASLISYRLGYLNETYLVHDVQELRDWWQTNQSHTGL